LQIKSRQRVIDHGEVFTSEREVNAMLDLVAQETMRIDSRFLEPACGAGNFLIEVLRRKLNIVEQCYKKSPFDYQRYALLALTSLYGVDILEDNVTQCRDRLFDYFAESYERILKNPMEPRYQDSAKFILQRNILWGDALTMKTADDLAQPLVFPQWSLLDGAMIKRKDYRFDTLLAYQPMGEGTLFSDSGEQAIIPQAVKEFPLRHFLDLCQDG